MTGPAPYSNTDAEETLAIDTFKILVDHKQAKLDIRGRDKYPNIDGYIDIVDEESRPIGKLEAQVKKLPDDYESVPKLQIPFSLFRYAAVTNNPVLLIGVDTRQKKAYWIHVSIYRNLRQAHKTITVNFPGSHVIDGKDTEYLADWIQIVRRNQNKLLEYDKVVHDLSRLSHVVNAARGFAKAHLREMQAYRISRRKRRWGVSVREGRKLQTKSRVHVVDPRGRGEYATISQAIEAAKAGDKILVKPGHYAEQLVIVKPLEIVGDGNTNEIVVRTSGKPTVLFGATKGRLVNISFVQAKEKTCISIHSGRLELEGCDISIRSMGVAAGVAISDGSHSRLRRNTIHSPVGVWVFKNSRATLEQNEFVGCRDFGVYSDKAHLTLRANRIKGSEQPCYFRSSRVVMDGNDVYRNYRGITGDSSVLTVRGNRVCDNKEIGVAVFGKSRADIDHNEICDNKRGVFVTGSSKALIHRNMIHSNTRGAGVVLYRRCRCIIQDNTIRENLWGVHIVKGGMGILRRNAINGNRYFGVRVLAGSVMIKDNDLRGNLIAPVGVHPGSVTNVREARNLE